MVNKRLLTLGIFFGMLFLFIGMISAASCSIKDILSCNANSLTPGNGIILSLTDTTNAHGEDSRDFGDATYSQHLCCDFDGTGDSVLDNLILKLSGSSGTNAHAEINTEENYDTNVNFGDLVCRVDSVCDGLNDIPLMSLSGETNAHIGAFGDYVTKICCNWPANAFWSSDGVTPMSTPAVYVGSSIKLVLEKSGLDLGDYNSNQNRWGIFEEDTLNNDEIYPKTGDSRTITGAVTDSPDGSRILTIEWTVTQEDYDQGSDFLVEQNPTDFFFTANTIDSRNYVDAASYLQILDNTNTNAFCSDETDEASCTACYDAATCLAANSAGPIAQDQYGVGCNELLPSDPNFEIICSCGWSLPGDAAGVCEPQVSIDSVGGILGGIPHCTNGVQDADSDPLKNETGLNCNDLDGADCGVCINGEAVPHCTNGVPDKDEDGADCGGADCGRCNLISFPKIGSCTYVSQEDEDDCADNFLEYTWEGKWAWGVNNEFDTYKNPFSSDEEDYIQDSLTNKYHYDPLRLKENCKGGSSTIPCPAEIQLPFFGFFNMIGALVLIALIYLSLIFKNERNF